MKKFDAKVGKKSIHNLPMSKAGLKSVDQINQFAEDIINTVREPLLVLDEKLRVIKASRSFYNFFKVTPGETIGTLIYDLGNQQWNIPKLRELLETILPDKTSFDNYEVEHDFSRIGKRVMLLNARQIQRAIGNEKIILLAIEDITERKLVEESLSESNRINNEYLDILLDHAHAPIIIWDSSLIIKRFNHEFEKLSGYNWTEVRDKKIEMLFPKDKIESTLELIKNTLPVENHEIIEIEILAKDKNIKTVLWNSANVFEKEGENIVATIAHDITKRKRTEEALAILETRYRRLFESAKDGILILNAETGMIIDVNPYLIELLGYSHEVFVEKAIWEIGFFKDIAANEDKFFELQQKEYVRYENLPLETFDGRKINVEFVSNVYLVNNHKVIQCNIRDITERIRVDDALKENEKRFRELFDNAPIGYHELDTNGRISRINRTELNMMGYAAEEMIGQFVWKFVGDEEESKKRVLEKLNGALLPTNGEERIYNRKDRTTFPALAEEKILHDSENNIIGIRTTIQNITLLKKAENELRKLSRAVEQTPALIIITDLNGNIEYVNPKLLEITGYQLEEVIGENPKIFSSKEKSKTEYKILWDTISSGKEWRGEFHNKKKNGQLYWESALISPVANENGIITNFIAIKEDITEKKQAEQELIAAKEKAEEMNRLKSSFLANMSHELRTPLIGILGYAELLESGLKNKEFIEMARIIGASGKRLNTTLNNLLNLSKIESEKQQINLKELDILKYLREQVTLFKAAAVEKGLSLNFESSEEKLNAYIDEEMFISIINNLISNAIKYTNIGCITLFAERENGNAVIEIADTGIGVPQDLQDIIFEPFRQASEGYSRNFEGTGLGLTLVKKYIDLMGGTINMKSKPEVRPEGSPGNGHGKAGGSVFTLKLPTHKILAEV